MRAMASSARLSWLLALLHGAVAIAGQPELRPIALVATYADGRVTESLVGPNGLRAWTPMFPRLAGWQEPRNVLPVTALNVAAKVEGDRVLVWVSVLRGPTREVNDSVAEVVVGIDDPVVVEDLRRVGLQPVTYSAKLFAAPALHVPRLMSRVVGLELETAEPSIEPTPGYQITVRNRTDVPLVTAAFSTFVGGQPALSGQQGDPAAVPLAAPGGTFTFRLGIRSARQTGRDVATAEPLDEVALVGAIWADGHLDGDLARVRPLLAVHRGRMEALQPVIAILRSARRGVDPLSTLDEVRRAIAAIPTAASAMAVATVIRLVPSNSPNVADSVGPAVSVGSQNVRERLLADIDRVRPQLTAAEARRWLDDALPACEAWMTRLQALFH